MEKINYAAFDRITSNMAREFGSIKKGTEEDYAFCLYPILNSPKK
jgi:hypothetical protein